MSEQKAKAWRLLVTAGVVASCAVLVVAGLVPVATEQPTPTDDQWCDAMLDKPDRDWSEQDITTFSQNCL